MSPYRTISLLTRLTVVAVPLAVGDAAGIASAAQPKAAYDADRAHRVQLTPTGATLTWNKPTDT
jgi:hypothetical protein